MVCQWLRGIFQATFALLLATAFCSPVFGLQGTGTGGEDDDEPSFGGIEINADGVIGRRSVTDKGGVLDRQRWQAAKTSLDQNLQKTSNLRCVSLTRLENEIRQLLEAGKSIPDDMKYLAGLTKVTHVFYYPETKDIVIAGPAEGFFLNSSNSVVGLESGKSVLQLQDLVVALRAFGPTDSSTRVISCSIDPTQEGIQRLNEAVRSVQQNAASLNVAQIVNIFRQALGMQVISIQGVSNRTNFARVMVEADYRMKLIGIGLEQPAVRMTTFVEKVNPQTLSKNALVRWYFQPDYDCVMINQDETAISFVGGAVKLIGEDELVSQKGQRKNVGRTNRASKAYCESFTKVYNQLSAVDPIWAELRNVMDLSIVAAFIQKYDLYEKAGWNLDVFGDEAKFRTEINNPVTQVAPVANAIFKNGALMTPIAGGVAVQPMIALNSDRLKQDQEGKITQSQSQTESRLGQLAEGQWWWD
jgi:hypothetical protein